MKVDPARAEEVIQQLRYLLGTDRGSFWYTQALRFLHAKPVWVPDVPTDGPLTVPIPDRNFSGSWFLPSENPESPFADYAVSPSFVEEHVKVVTPDVHEPRTFCIQIVPFRQPMRTNEIDTQVLVPYNVSEYKLSLWALWHLVSRQAFGQRGLIPITEEQRGLMFLPGTSGTRLVSVNWGGQTWGVDSEPLTGDTLWREGSVLFLPL